MARRGEVRGERGLMEPLLHLEPWQLIVYSLGLLALGGVAVLLERRRARRTRVKGGAVESFYFGRATEGQSPTVVDLRSRR